MNNIHTTSCNQAKKRNPCNVASSWWSGDHSFSSVFFSSSLLSACESSSSIAPLIFLYICYQIICLCILPFCLLLTLLHTFPEHVLPLAYTVPSPHTVSCFITSICLSLCILFCFTFQAFFYYFCVPICILMSILLLLLVWCHCSPNLVLHSSQFFMLCSFQQQELTAVFTRRKSHMVVLYNDQLCKATEQTFDTVCEDCFPTPSLKKKNCCENLKTYFLLADNFHLQFSYRIFLK